VAEDDPAEPSESDEPDELDELDDSDAPDDPDRPVELPIGDVLDLHSFAPREIRDLVRDWLDAAHTLGLRDLRVVHGRGVGVQRDIVRRLLAGDPRVIAFGDAPPEAGGWGATWVKLR
jgi:DNA-nicking Smr family endonuclease